MHDDGIESVALFPCRAALLALLRKGQRLLEGAVGNADALQADAEARLVHHGEHAGHAFVLFADEIADRAAGIAHGHGAGGGGVDAELVLDARGIDVVALAQRAVGIDEEFRHQEQRNAPRARGRIGQACEHEMHDVVGHVVFAIGDEDLRALEAIAAVIGALGAGAQRADIGAGAGLGELHGAGPFARHEFREIDVLQFVGAMRIERLDAAVRQQRAEAEGHVRRAPDFRAGGVDRERQALPAEFFRPRHRVPARFRPAPIGIRPARRGRHHALVQLDAVLVPYAIERREHVAGEFAGFLQHGGSDVAVEIAVMPGLDRGLQPRAMVERKQHVGDRRGVGHGGARTWGGAGNDRRYAAVSRNPLRLNGGWADGDKEDYGRNSRRFPGGNGRDGRPPHAAPSNPHGEEAQSAVSTHAGPASPGVLIYKGLPPAGAGRGSPRSKAGRARRSPLAKPG
ncbi:hypothetical protein ES707_11236 [subsurface metagenome]